MGGPRMNHRPWAGVLLAAAFLLVPVDHSLAAGSRSKSSNAPVDKLERDFVAGVEKVEQDFAGVIEELERRFEKALVGIEGEFEKVLTGLERRPRDKRLREQFAALQGKVEKLGQEVAKLKRTAQFLESGPGKSKSLRR